jgi:uncharacterized Zn-finger protein
MHHLSALVLLGLSCFLCLAFQLLTSSGWEDFFLFPMVCSMIPVIANLCDEAFRRLGHQTRHIRTHTGEKPHACQFSGCTKRFARPDRLTQHSRALNPNPSNKTQQGLRVQNGSLGSAVATMMPPPNNSISISTPTSAFGLSKVHTPSQHTLPTSNLS